MFPNPAIWNPSTGENNPFVHWEFWLALACQIVIVIGYFVFFRKEQLVSLLEAFPVFHETCILTLNRVNHKKRNRMTQDIERRNRADIGRRSKVESSTSSIHTKLVMTHVHRTFKKIYLCWNVERKYP